MYNSMRVGGLATGMDIDSIVDNLMRVERMPLDKLKQQKQVLEWQQEDYREINTLLLNLRNTIFDMRLQSTFNAYIANSSDQSIISATASSAASATSFTFDSITSLAKAAGIRTADDVSISSQVYKISAEKPLQSPVNISEVQSFMISYDNGEFLEIALDPAVYDNKSGGRMYSDLVADIQSKLDQALGQDKVKVTLDRNNKLQFTADGTAAFTIKQEEGQELFSALGFEPDASGTIQAQRQGMDTNQSLYTLIQQGILDGNKFDWIADVSDSFVVNETGTSFVSNINYADIRADYKKENITIKVNGSYYKAVTDESQLKEGAVLLEDDGNGKLKLTFFEEQEIEEGSSIQIDRHDFEFSISSYNQGGQQNTETFTINALNQSMNTVVSYINNSKTLDLNAFYDSSTDKMVLTAKRTGNNNANGQDITVSGAFAEQLLGLNHYTSGQDAQFTVNGLATTRKNNDFTINGVSFNLKATSDTPVTITTSRDIDSVVDNIKGFVDTYNETIDTINQKIHEERYKDYPPLTDEQKDVLKDSQIEKWEEKARSGMLARDAMLESILSDMRNMLMESVDGVDSKYNTLYSIGITTGPYYERGKLNLNEAKLREAIETDADGVAQMFRRQTEGDYRQSGIAVRMHDTITGGMDRISEKAGTALSFSKADNSQIGSRIRDLEKDIDSWQDRLKMIENRYWNQYTQMEKAINQMNQQSMWLTQQLGMWQM
ncbi:MAG: flagellar filament capping protein FliD [Clostridia bacterium]|nr:flagellar filament capping protein FliD [Clostridia bacterium]